MLTIYKIINKNEGAILNAGSVIKNGECNAVVIATGIKTFFGKTAQPKEAKCKYPLFSCVIATINMTRIMINIIFFLTKVIKMADSCTYICLSNSNIKNKM